MCQSMHCMHPIPDGGQCSKAARSLPKNKARSQNENEPRKEKGHIRAVQQQEAAPAHPVVALLKPVQDVTKHLEALQRQRSPDIWSDIHMR